MVFLSAATIVENRSAESIDYLRITPVLGSADRNSRDTRKFVVMFQLRATSAVFPTFVRADRDSGSDMQEFSQRRKRNIYSPRVWLWCWWGSQSTLGSR